MSQRSITYCVEELQVAWYAAEKKYKELYPNMAQPFLTCTYRSPEEQTKLYNQPTDGIDNDGDGKIDESDECVTHAKAGQSYHNYYPSKAFDIAFKNKDGKLIWDIDNFIMFAKLMEEINPKIIWGGRWKPSKRDNPHFELH